MRVRNAWRKQFSAEKPRAPFSFHGGLKLDTSKRALTRFNSTGIKELPLPAKLVVPLIDYHKNNIEPLVNIQQTVSRGQTIAPGIISPANGTVSVIEPCEFIHPGGLSVNSVVIDTHANNSENPPVSIPSAKAAQAMINSFAEQPIETLEQAALVGLGGAGFPTLHKIKSANNGIHTLIINAAECEPEIACDEALMLAEPEAIALGIETLVQLTQCQQCIIAIEDSKPLAQQQLSEAINTFDVNAAIMTIPTRYPTGAETTLIEVVTGKRLAYRNANSPTTKSQTTPSEHGIVCINIGTAHALWQMVERNQALDSRVVSLGGSNMRNPCNVRVRFGTPVNFVLSATDNTPDNAHTRIRAGGPLSGFDLHSLNAPITANTNCILAEAAFIETPAQPCIRCGQCADVCPVKLLPQQLHWYAQSEDHDKCAQLNLAACIECGCCDLVCPASIKLTETFRYAKSTARFLSEQNQKADEAEQRFKNREERLKQREADRKAAIEKRKQAVKSQDKKTNTDRIKAALERARTKQKSSKD